VSLTSEIKGEVQQLIRQGKKSDAIRVLCERLGVSASEAATLADAAEIEMKLTNQGTDADSAVVTSLVKSLLRDGKKIEAVKVIRERQNLSLSEALRRVEDIESLINPDAPKLLSKTRSGFPSLFGKIFAGIGILLAAIALSIFYSKQNAIAKSEIGEGQVVDLIWSGDTSTPRIAYNWKGVKRYHISGIYTNPPAYDVGEKVELYIDRNNPGVVMINSFTGRWLAIVIVSGIAVFFVGFGLLFIFLSGKF
jgi:ribosomal protein L7/L12